MEDLRRVLKWNEETQNWDDLHFKKLKKGDKFAMYESDGEYVGTYVADSDVFEKDGVWAILTQGGGGENHDKNRNDNNDTIG